MVARQLLLRVKRRAAQRAERVAALHMRKAVQAAIVTCTIQANGSSKAKGSQLHGKNKSMTQLAQAESDGRRRRCWCGTLVIAVCA